jgi:DNA-binding beta-propeller fold protein YncE
MKNTVKFLGLLLSLGYNHSTLAADFTGVGSVPLTGISATWGVAQGGGFLYVSDGDNDQVVKFDAQGLEVGRFGASGAAQGEFSMPAGLALGPDGLLYVADFGNDRVQVLSADGQFVRQIGAAGSADGEMISPSDVAVAADGTVFVTDSGNQRVESFSAAGAYLAQFGNADLSSPMGLGLDPASHDILVADTGHARVLRFNAAGQLIFTYGHRGLVAGTYDSPVDVVVLGSGSLMVADNGAQRIQMLDADGTFVKWWGFGDNGAFFEDLYALTLGPDGRVLVGDGLSGKLFAMVDDSMGTQATWYGSGPSNIARTDGKSPASIPTKAAMGPVPSRPGESLCLWLADAPRESRWSVYSVDGRNVANVDFSGQAQQCWTQTAGLASGLYFVKMQNSWSDGRQEQSMQKIIIRN